MIATSKFSACKFFLINYLLISCFSIFSAPGQQQPYRMAKKPKTADEKDDNITKVVSKQSREKEKTKVAKYEELKKMAEEKPESRIKKRRLYAHRNKTGRQTYSNMKFEELMQLRDKKIAEKKSYKNKQYVSNINESLIIFTERLVKLSEDINVIAQLMLDLAELYYEEKQYTKAAAIFKEFSQLYPGNEKTEYALYKGVSCMYETVKDISPERDQSKVKETIELAQKFLDRKIFTQYKDEVGTIQTACYKQLIDYELGVVTFYLKNDNLSVTQKRLDYVRSELLAKATSKAPQVLEYEITLAERKHDDQLVAQKKLELAELIKTDGIDSLPVEKKPTYFFAWKF